jgi:hypothetical protein
VEWVAFLWVIKGHGLFGLDRSMSSVKFSSSCPSVIAVNGGAGAKISVGGGWMGLWNVPQRLLVKNTNNGGGAAAAKISDGQWSMELWNSPQRLLVKNTNNGGAVGDGHGRRWCWR